MIAYSIHRQKVIAYLTCAIFPGLDHEIQSLKLTVNK